jgi:hypothetical protein
MKKFGWFERNEVKPLQEFEGEWLECSGEVVRVISGDGAGGKAAYAVIRLAEGQSVKVMK